MRLRRSVLRLALIALLVASGCAADPPEATQPSPVQAYDVRNGSRPHDVAPADDGGVWFTGQRAGFLGHFNPSMQGVTEVPLGEGSAPHGVIVGPDGAAWVTDGGLNAIVRVDSATREVRRYPLPAGREGASLNTATFDHEGVLWFTGQAGVYGRLDPRTGRMTVYFDPASEKWREWRLPGPKPQAYAVYVDDQDQVWVSDFGTNALVRFNPTTEIFTSHPLPGPASNVRQILGRAGEVWGAASALDQLVVIRGS
jgi:virginiamycin B lyase